MAVAQRLLFLNAESELVQLLEEQFTGLANRIREGPNCVRTPLLFPHPLPNLAATSRVAKNQQMLEVILGDQLVELKADSVIRNDRAMEGRDASLFRNSLERVAYALDFFQTVLPRFIPSKLIEEETPEVE